MKENILFISFEKLTQDKLTNLIKGKVISLTKTYSLV